MKSFVAAFPALNDDLHDMFDFSKNYAYKPVNIGSYSPTCTE